MDTRNRTLNTPLLTVLKAYKKFLSPILVTFIGGSCRLQPTCSEYAQQAVHKHGAIKGSLLSIYRVLRCNPLNEGGHDPV